MIEGYWLLNTSGSCAETWKASRRKTRVAILFIPMCMRSVLSLFSDPGQDFRFDHFVGQGAKLFEYNDAFFVDQK